jgi:hypothetical protein
VALGLMGVSEAGIECFECDSSRNFTCTEFWDPTLPVTARYLTNCEHVYKAGTGFSLHCTMNIFKCKPKLAYTHFYYENRTKIP